MAVPQKWPASELLLDHALYSETAGRPAPDLVLRLATDNNEYRSGGARHRYRLIWGHSVVWRLHGQVDSILSNPSRPKSALSFETELGDGASGNSHIATRAALLSLCDWNLRLLSP